MKFVAIIVMSVLFCAMTTSTAPIFDGDKEITELRDRLKCIFDVFDVIIREYKELEKYYSLPQTYLNVSNIMLDRCAEMENSDLTGQYPYKQQCFDTTEDIVADVYIKDFLYKLQMENKKLTQAFMDEEFVKHAVSMCPNIPGIE